MRLSTRSFISLATLAVCLSFSRLARAVSSNVCATAMSVTSPVQTAFFNCKLFSTSVSRESFKFSFASSSVFVFFRLYFLLKTAVSSPLLPSSFLLLFQLQKLLLPMLFSVWLQILPVFSVQDMRYSLHVPGVQVSTDVV